MECDRCHKETDAEKKISKYNFHFMPNGKWICNDCFKERFNKIRSR